MTTPPLPGSSFVTPNELEVNGIINVPLPPPGPGLPPPPNRVLMTAANANGEAITIDITGLQAPVPGKIKVSYQVLA